MDGKSQIGHEEEKEMAEPSALLMLGTALSESQHKVFFLQDFTCGFSRSSRFFSLAVG
jgi:hypothetical protein